MSRTPIGAQSFVDESGLDLEYGGRLPELEIAYESWGHLASSRDNAILVCPAFSGHSHAASHEGDPSPGWWEGMIGPGLALDSDRYYIVCPSLLAGSYGTTGPLSTNPQTGKPYGGKFPIVTVRDLVSAHIRLLDHLGIDRLYAAVGGSLGGMETLELGIRHPHRAARILSASATDRTRPFTAAIRHLGRRAILLDPEYDDGDYQGHGPAGGIGLARQIGTLFYRTREEFDQRFRWQPIHEPSVEGVTFDVQSYLRHQGEKILGSFDANSYLILSLAMDLHDIWRGFPSREGALDPVTAEFMIIGVEEDRLIPVDEQEWVHHALITAGKTSHWHRISNHVGHDTFLIDKDTMSDLTRKLLSAPAR